MINPERFTDFSVVQGEDGIYDGFLADDGDIGLTDDLFPALLVSLFTDRRAAEDEVISPLDRRGWLGNLLSGPADENWGSGIWLYEQSRLRDEDIEGVRVEGEQSLSWLVDEDIATSVEARTTARHARRQCLIDVLIRTREGDVVQQSFDVVANTRANIIR